MSIISISIISISIIKNVQSKEVRDLINYFKNYQLTEQDIKEGKIYCLYEFYVYPDTEENIDKNLDVKWDLEDIIKSGSCYGLSCYIYQLITYIQTTHVQRV